MTTPGNLEQAFTGQYPELADTGVSYSIRLSTLQVNSTKAGNFVLQAAMLYGAVVLMVICLTVLSLQKLLDAGPVPLPLLRPAETGCGGGTHRKAGAPAAWSVVWASHRRSDSRFNGGDRLFPADRVRGDRRLHRVQRPDGADRRDNRYPGTAADLLFSQHLAAVQKGHRNGSRREGASRVKEGCRLRQAGSLLRMLLSSQPIEHIIGDRIGASRNR